MSALFVWSGVLGLAYLWWGAVGLFSALILLGIGNVIVIRRGR